MIISVILILLFTFFVRETMVLRHSGSRGVMLIPFRELVGLFRESNHSFFFWQITLNVFLFVPFGFLVTAYLYLYSKKSTISNWLTVLLLGFAFSLLIEGFQFITGRGYTEVDDIINNTFGALIGYLMYRCFLKKYKNEQTKGNY